MEYEFTKHYTLEEARLLLPPLRGWIAAMQQLQKQIESCDRRLAGRLAEGTDVGGQLVNERVRLLASFAAVFQELRDREIQIKDLDRGLVDFPCLRQGREVFLCWELEDDDIEFWHEIHTGYAGREKI